MRKITLGIAGLVATAGMALMGAGAANAAPAPHFGNVGSFYSTHLAGTFLSGNGLVTFAGTWRQFSLPDESAAPAYPAPGSIVPDDVAEGNVLTQYVTGGYAYAEAMVLNDTVHSGACTGSNEYTLEYTPVPYDITATVSNPEPVPASALVPIDSGGSPVVCVAGGGSEFLFVYHSSGHHEVIFLAGPGAHNTNVYAVDYHQFITLRGGASGVTTTTAGNAGNLVNGNIVASSGVGYYESGHGNSTYADGQNLARLNYSVMQGTLSGGAPSVTDPETLTVSPTAVSEPYGAYGITAP